MLKLDRIKIVLVLIALVTFIFPIILCASGLEFRLSSLKATYLISEPVFIDFELKNTGTVAIKTHPKLELETTDISLFIAPREGPFQKYDPGRIIEPSLSPKELEPSQSIINRQLVLYDALSKKYAFPDAGVYRVKAVYYGFVQEDELESNTIEIRIEEPLGIDAEAIRFFKIKDVAFLIMNVNESPEAVKNLELLMARYPASIYGKYAQFHIAMRQTREFFARKPNFDHAIRLFNDLIQRDPKFPLVVETNFQLGAALIQVGRYEEARQRLNFVLKESKDTRMISKTQRLMKRIIK